MRKNHDQADRLPMEGGRLLGLRYRTRGTQWAAKCSGEVILSAGLISLPQVLMNSCVGPGDLLQESGIEVRQVQRATSENLQDHLQARMIYRTKEPIALNDRLRNPVKKALMDLEYAIFCSRLVSMVSSQVCIFAKTNKGLETPDIQHHVQPWSADSPGEGTHRISAFTMSVCQLRPESRGRVCLKTPDPKVAPVVEPNYLSTETDRRVAVDSIMPTIPSGNSNAPTIMTGEKAADTIREDARAA